MRFVIINADDFGQSPSVNDGVIQAHEQGILTSASLMVRWSAAPAAAEYARTHTRLSTGLHLDLGEWSLRDSDWVRLYQVVDEDDPDAVSAEVARQVDAFCDLVGRPPTHIDSHQHVHRREPVRSAVLAAAARFDIPVREISLPYVGGFYGQDEVGASHPEWVSRERLIQLLTELRAGVTEIGSHPATAADLSTLYRIERVLELATLCDPMVRNTIEEMGIGLVSFLDWKSVSGGSAGLAS